MNSYYACARVLWLLALIASPLAWAQDDGLAPEPGAKPPVQAGATDPAALFSKASALKLTRPNLFGEADWSPNRGYPHS